jgi:YhcH/YjgK/YiaL family protein
MIVDHLTHADAYLDLSPGFRHGIEFLRQFDPTTPPGRYDLAGDELFALVQHYTTKPPGEKRFESHRRYADIQYVAQGAECLWFVPRAALHGKTDYNPEKDVEHYAEPATGMLPLRVQTGGFVMFFPQDGHKPGCIDHVSTTVIKVVLKMRLYPG